MLFYYQNNYICRKTAKEIILLIAFNLLYEIIWEKKKLQSPHSAMCSAKIILNSIEINF